MSDAGKQKAIEVLEAIARLLELKGENSFKVRAYVNAARALEMYNEDLHAAARENRLGEIPGIGSAIAAKLTELLTTGRLAYYDKLRDEFPPEIFQLFEIPGLGAKKIKLLYDNLQIHSIARLEHACKEGKIAELPGFGKKTAEKLLKAIEERKQHVGSFRLDEAAVLAERILEDLREHPAIAQVACAGSYRRRKEVLHDLDFVVSTKEPAVVIADFKSHHLVSEVIAAGDTKVSVRLNNGMQCDLRVVTNAEFPFALAYFTGSKEHNVALRSRALKRGWTLNEYRFAEVPGKKSEPIPEIYDEPSLYRALDLEWVEPELREDRGEITAAEKGTLPSLIRVENLRGTFHVHTNASDGRATLEQMADAAMELGLSYLGISDHSKSSVQANGLDERRLEKQMAEIDRLNETFEDFKLFKGVECDILKDGSLDLSDEILSRLDFVVASVHASFAMPEAEMTERIIKAISNPNVTMLGHLTGRLILTREGYAVDIPAVIQAAAETGTIIELNANPRRLDMDWRWWPLAREKGVRCSINPDAHRLPALQNLWFGVQLARKGWLTRNDVINTLPLGKVETVLAQKRGRR
jgi:DNA polymerase (family 10)